MCSPLSSPLSPNLSFCFSLLFSSPLLCSVSRCSPRPHASHTLTQESKSSSNLFSPFSSFYHYIPPSTRHLRVLLMALFPRKMTLLVKITHTLNHQNILGQHKALMFSKSKFWAVERSQSGFQLLVCSLVQAETGHLTALCHTAALTAITAIKITIKKCRFTWFSKPV